MDFEQISLAFGKQPLSPFPLRAGWDIVEPPPFPSPPEPVQLLRNTVSQPIGSQPLAEIVPRGGRITVVVSDATRKTGFSAYSGELLRILTEGGIKTSDITTIVGTGTHRDPTAEEIADIVGPDWPVETVIPHACDDKANLVHIGTTSRGTPVSINRAAVECDLLIVTGSVKYHYFAGFGGGRKGILPGIAARESIDENHKLTLQTDGPILSGPCRTGKLTGNPVSEDMSEAVAMMPAPVFLINTITNAHGQPVRMFAGDIHDAFHAGCSEVSKLYDTPIERKYPLVIASAGGYPSDITIIQTHKSFQFARGAVEDGGVLILVARMADRHALDIMIDWLKLPSTEAHIGALKKAFSISGKTALAWREKLETLKLILITDLTETECNALGAQKADDIADALSLAAPYLPSEPYPAAILPRAAMTFPVIK